MTNDQYWEDARQEAREDAPAKVRVYRCGDRTCGGLDCASCHGEVAARQFIAEQEERKEKRAFRKRIQDGGSRLKGLRGRR